MRYPGRHHRHKEIRLVIVAIASGFFLFSLWLALNKQSRIVASSRLPATSATSSVAATPSPTQMSASPTPTTSPQSATVTLKLVDGLTHQALAGQSIAVVETPVCAADTEPCPVVTPHVYPADEQGRIVLPKELVLAKPKLYAAGYKLDTYFSFLNSEQPQLLTLYTPPMDGAKTTYDITTEEVPVALTPVE